MRFIPHWRKATWAIVIWTVIFAIWIVGGINAASSTPCDPALTQELCDAATGIGTGIGVTLVFTLWLIGFIVLSIIWFMSRPDRSTEVYSPQGAKVMTSQKEARRLVEKQGWTYQRAATTDNEPPAPAT